MFVCAALIGITLCTTHGDVIVLFDETLVVPCWLITFKFKHSINEYVYKPIVPPKKKPSKREKKILRMEKKLKKKEKKKK